MERSRTEPPPAAPVLVEVRRGDHVESRHRGTFVVVDTEGRRQAGAGDSTEPVFVRSSIKALQALPLIESGAAERFELGSRELALAISSHDGEACHTEPVEAWLARLGLSTGALRCGPQKPRDRAARAALAEVGADATPLHNNCSGKHAGFLTLGAHLGADPAGYLERDAPVQRAAFEAIGQMCERDPAELEFAIDGCSAPTPRLTLHELAHAFAKLANPAGLEPRRRAACDRLTAAAAEHPALVAGNFKRLCTDLIAASGGRLFAKVGAESVYVIGARDRGLGLALKIEDGGPRALGPLVVGLLEGLDWIDADERERLAAWAPGPLRNWAGRVVGELEVCVP